MIYLHAYWPGLWEAQEKAGLISKNDGVRFLQSIDIREELKFNRLAAKNGPLYRLLQEQRRPFYIDRLQGGCFHEGYPYDMELVDGYRQLLGDRFWGFQMHEWMSNLRSDIRKIAENGCPAWTAEAITETVRRVYPFRHVFLEAMSAVEYESCGEPKSIEAFLTLAKTLFQKRQRYTAGDLLPCDSAYLAYPLELKNGARRLMPEIGAQTHDTRLQLAYARGMGRAANVPFGVYYEPWGGEPFSACCYQREGKNEWAMGKGDFPFDTCGENGGSSRSLQWRLHMYAYFAGASFISEEWGLCNIFTDWQEFALSPYGEIKRKFIRLSEEYPDPGEPLTPIAVVLPRDLPMLDDIFTEEDTLAGYPVFGTFADTLRRLRRGLRQLFCTAEPMSGDETDVLRNCTVPDALDIVNEDVLQLERYAYLVDLTGGPTLAARCREKLCRLEAVPELLSRLLPCWMTGGAMKQLTQRRDGDYGILLLNNSGVSRTVIAGERADPTAVETVTIAVNDGLTLTVLEGNSTVSRLDRNTYAVTLPAGGWMMGRLE